MKNFTIGLLLGFIIARDVARAINEAIERERRWALAAAINRATGKAIRVLTGQDS